MSIHDDALAELAALDAAGRRRGARVVDGPQGAWIQLDGARVLNLSSNDYLGLASDSRLVSRASEALSVAGAGASSSRLIVGTQREHVRLERAVADWMERESVRIFNSGYAANVGVLTTLLGPGDVVFSDALNHASIVDGCRLSRADIVVYPHGDVAALARAMRERHGRRRVVVTESLFSMDGDVPDLRAIAELCRRHDVGLIVDEAHAVGTHGPQGRGQCAESAVVPDVLVGTFGKAFGAFGAFVVSSHAVCELLWNRARSFVFSTALPPSVPAMAAAALEIVRSGDGDDRRRRLRAHARRLRAAALGFGGIETSPIAPLVLGDDKKTMALTARLLAAGVFVQGIRPPTVPDGASRLRLSLTAAHTDDDLTRALAALDNALRQ